MSSTSKLQYFEKVENKTHREFIKIHGNCVLCSTPLELKHIRNDTVSQIKEEAFCKECDVKIRAKIHTLN